MDLVQENFYKTFPSSQENHYLLEQFLHAGGAWLEPSFAASLGEEGEVQTQSWAESHSAILSVLWERWPGAELSGLLLLLSWNTECCRPSEKSWGAFGCSQVCIALSLTLVLCSLPEHHFETTVWEERQCLGSVCNFCSIPALLVTASLLLMVIFWSLETAGPEISRWSPNTE